MFSSWISGFWRVRSGALPHSWIVCQTKTWHKNTCRYTNTACVSLITNPVGLFKAWPGWDALDRNPRQSQNRGKHIKGQSTHTRERSNLLRWTGGHHGGLWSGGPGRRPYERTQDDNLHHLTQRLGTVNTATAECRVLVKKFTGDDHSFTEHKKTCFEYHLENS